jgi:hypothetical protein
MQSNPSLTYSKKKKEENKMTLILSYLSRIWRRKSTLLGRNEKQNILAM